MVVQELNPGNFKPFDLTLKWSARRLVGIATILLDYVLRWNKFGNYRADWSSR